MSLAIPRALLGERFIAYVWACYEAGVSVEKICEITKQPELIIGAILRSPRLITTA